MHIGKNIKAIREQQGLSQEELAHRLKIRKKTLMTIEQMEHLYEIGIRRAAVALGITVGDLMNFRPLNRFY